MSEKVPEEVQTGALPDQDEVRVAVGEVGRGREALGTAGTRAAHTGRVDGNELVMDHPPTAAVVCKTGVKAQNTRGLKHFVPLSEVAKHVLYSEKQEWNQTVFLIQLQMHVPIVYPLVIWTWLIGV